MITRRFPVAFALASLTAAIGCASSPSVEGEIVLGERDAARIEARIRRVLAMSPGVRPEYISVVEPDGLAPVETVDGGTVVAIAARIGSTRLIDNIILGEGLG